MLVVFSRLKDLVKRSDTVQPLCNSLTALTLLAFQNMPYEYLMSVPRESFDIGKAIRQWPLVYSQLAVRRGEKQTLSHTHQNHFLNKYFTLLPFGLSLLKRAPRVSDICTGFFSKSWVKDHLQINLCVLICVQYMMAGIYCTSTIKAVSAKSTGCQSHRNILNSLSNTFLLLSEK